MSDLVGRTITEVRPMTPAELRKEYWSGPGTVLVLDDGTKLYPSCDEEGNDPGALFGSSPDGKQFGVR